MADYYKKAIKNMSGEITPTEIRKKQEEHFKNFSEHLTGIEAEDLLIEEKVREQVIKGI